VDKKNVTQDDLDFPNGNRTIRIVPIIIGSKKAGFSNYSGRCSGGGGGNATFGFGQAWGAMLWLQAVQ
jgi:predicted phage tail protein